MVLHCRLSAEGQKRRLNTERASGPPKIAGKIRKKEEKISGDRARKIRNRIEKYRKDIEEETITQ